jgi:photosystem II oxygen-evolving enhancer protein 2
LQIKIMASTTCFLHHAPATAKTSLQRAAPSTAKPSQFVCRAQKQGEEDVAVSRRLALTALVGVAAVGMKVKPADAAYGEAGKILFYELQ